jgi:hypothetical protein
MALRVTAHAEVLAASSAIGISPFDALDFATNCAPRASSQVGPHASNDPSRYTYRTEAFES